LDDVEWVNLLADEAVGPMLSGDLAAAYLYEPWITKVKENMDGAASAVDTADPAMLETGIFMDVVYMNGNFIKERRAAAKDMLKLRYDALGWWHENTDAGNKILSDYLKWPVADIESVIGTNGKYLEGGIYMYDFDESARVCGVIDGEPPFGLVNGAMPTVVKTVNEWWVRLGLMETVHEPEAGIDCSLMADLVADGYAQELVAR
jgi:NitT/TauT family transport system substrate-binding protein